MADITVRSQALTRDQIAEIVGKNPRAIKVLEDLIFDTVTTLPNAIDEVQLSALFSLHGADGSKESAQMAMGLVRDLQSILTAGQRSAPDLAGLRGEIDLLRMELHDTRTHLLSAVQQAQRAADSALTLVSGV